MVLGFFPVEGVADVVVFLRLQLRELVDCGGGEGDALVGGSEEDVEFEGGGVAGRGRGGGDYGLGVGEGDGAEEGGCVELWGRSQYVLPSCKAEIRAGR